MFQSILSNLLQAIPNLLFWSWAHPIVAGLMLSGVATTLFVWLHVPKRLEYYWQNGKVTIHPFNVRNEIPQYVSGRIAVWRFCRKHGIGIAFGGRMNRVLLELLLFIIRVPHPRVYYWEACFAAMPVYPLGNSRREFIDICIRKRIWPWTRTETIQRVLDGNHGNWPGLEQRTFVTSFTNRLFS